MNAFEPSEPPSGPPTNERPKRRWRGVVIFSIGAILVVAAIVAVARQGSGIAGIVGAVRNSPAWLVVFLAALPFLNWLSSAASFHVLTSRYGRVGAVEMGAVIGSSWLLNYLPLRPGLIGRVAYHKKVNNIPIAASVQVFAFSIGLSTVAIVVMLASLFLLNWQTSATGRTWPAWIAMSVPAFAGGVASAWLRARSSPSWRFVAGGALKFADLIVWAARYWACFSIVGVDLTPTQCAGVAAVTQLVLLIPLAGNGLGLREWAVGLVASSLPAWFAGGAVAPTRVDGLSADLVNRGAEVVAALLVGVWGTIVVARRAARVDERKGS